VSRLAALAAVALVAALLGANEFAGAAFTTHQSNPQAFSARAAPPAVLVAQSQTNNGGASSAQILYGLKLRNTGTAAVDLSTVTMRYWFTSDGSIASLPVVECYYATFGCATITQSAVDLPGLISGADHYAQVKFTGGALAPGTSATLDQLAIRDPLASVYRQDNDHSFLNQGAFTDNPRVTVYSDGLLVWGTEPAPLPRSERVEVRYRNLDPDPANQAILPGLDVINTGTVDLDARRLTLRYWFTPEGAQQLLGFCQYAEVGCPQVTARTGQVSPPRPGAGAYLEVGFSGGIVEAGSRTGEIHVRINKSDYTNFAEGDDYSYRTNTAFASTTTVTAYLDGKLVWGTEP